MTARNRREAVRTETVNKLGEEYQVRNCRKEE
jgi:hypothetical protein